MKSRCSPLTLALALLALAALAVPAALAADQYSREEKMTMLTTIVTHLKTMATACEMYRIDQGLYPDSIAQLYPDYLKRDDERDGSYTYQPAADHKSFMLCFRDDLRPIFPKIPLGYPRYSSIPQPAGTTEYMPKLTNFTRFLETATQ